MISHRKNKIKIESFEWKTEFSILSAKEFEGNVIVIFDYMEFPKHGVAKNLYSYSTTGQLIWIAENPTSLSSDGYTNFIKRNNELWVYNFAGIECRIDPSTGKILESIFTK